MREIALNFFSLETDQFKITLYRLPFVEGKRPTRGGEKAVRRHLTIDGKSDMYWTLFQQTENSMETVCAPFDNVYLTIDALRWSLIQNCVSKLPSENFRVIEKIRHHVEIVISKSAEGLQVVSLEPYFLRSRKQFGFLADFRFHPIEEHRHTLRASKLSLSLDKNGRKNLNHYADRYSFLADFVNKFHSRIFPLNLPGGQQVSISRKLTGIPYEKLDVKRYIVGTDKKESNSQFMGVKEAGPLKQSALDTHLYFLYRPEDRTLSRDLYRALRGDTFTTFPGMENMFHFPISKENVSGATLSDFSDSEIQRVRDRVVADAAGRNVIPIVLSPFSKHDDPKDNSAYWFLKHCFLEKGLPIQVVFTDTVADINKLKWSIASIGLQVFAKAGGTPWKVRPQTKNCLIVGVGKAHHVSERGIERYFAYSVLTDSSGVFEEVRVLGDDQDENNYIESFSTNLRNIFADYSHRFSSFVVHATFTIRRRELDSIATALSKWKEQAGEGEFVSIKFNDGNRFFGFAMDHNSRVPYESTLIRLSRNEFLVWFEGLQYSQPTVRKMIGRPLHVNFIYPQEGLPWSKQRAYLQDAINLSGANWRGFNAKSLPISVYYAQLIAKYLKGFDGHGLARVNVNIFKPWFL